MAEMKKRGIGLPGRVYDIPLHRQPLFKNVSTQTFPDAEDICARHLCLPIFAGMTDTEVNYVIEALSDGLALVARS
jgi:dTDP-4-amino-4,6-dideoxygalactose transaminase